MSKVPTKTHRISSGDVLPTIVVLRKLMSAYDDAAFALRASFEDVDEHAEVLAAQLRLQVRDTANGVFELLEHIETLPEYQRQRREKLDT